MLTVFNHCKRYHALDKSYHALLRQVDDLNGQIHDLSNKVVALTGQSDGEKQQIDNLQKKLAETLDDAAKKQAELTDQVQSLQKSLTQEKAHDAEDEKALDVAHEQIKSDQAAQAALQKQVVALQFALAEGARRIQQFQAKISALVQEISNLRGQLAAEKAHNADLQTQAAELKATVAVVQTEVSALKKTLERTAEDLKQALADSSDKDSIIEGLENGMVAIKKDRDAKKTAYEELQKSSSATIQQLEEEIAQLKAGQTAGGGGGDGTWPYPDGWPFPGDSNRGSCWPTPDDLLKQIGGH
jgi:chromosome segregation ATPase